MRRGGKWELEIPVVDGPYHGDAVKYSGRTIMVRAKGSFVAGQYRAESRQVRDPKPNAPRYELYYQWFGPPMKREGSAA